MDKDALTSEAQLRERESALKEAQRRQAFILDLNDQIRAVDDPAAIMVRAAEMLGQCIRVNRVGYGEVNRQDGSVTIERDWTDGTLPNVVGIYPMEIFDASFAGALRRGETFVAEDLVAPLQTGAAEQACFEAIGRVHAMMIVPLVKNGALTAALFVHQLQPRRWSSIDIALAEEVAERTWSAVERARAEAALRKSEERFRISQEAGGVGLWDWNIEADEMFWSDKLFDLLGVPRDLPLDSRTFSALVHPDDRHVLKSAVEAVMRDQGSFDVELRVVRPVDGQVIWIASRGELSRDASGRPHRLAGVNYEITKRKIAEERQQLLIRELHHRVKNTLATVQAIVGSTARTASSIDEFYESFVGRIVSLAQTHNMLTDDLWQKASLEQMLRNELGPYDEGSARLSLKGPAVELPSEVAVPIGMAIHELTTNAVKHGALSSPHGRIDITWQIISEGKSPMLHLTWQECDGPAVRSPTRQGFGSRLLQRVLTAQVQANVSIAFEEKGLRFTIVMPLPRNATLHTLLS